ncbi:hypothetical protein J3E61_003036 [Mycobacterium sp. OAE908]
MIAITYTGSFPSTTNASGTREHGHGGTQTWPTFSASRITGAKDSANVDVR